MSKVVSIRLKDDQFKRLQKIARRTGHTSSTTAARLMEEALRKDEFPLIEFRDNGLEGRVAYLQGTRFKVWLTAALFRGANSDVKTMAAGWGIREMDLREILRYAEAYPEEVEPAIAEDQALGERMARGEIPGIEVFNFDKPAARDAHSRRRQ